MRKGRQNNPAFKGRHSPLPKRLQVSKFKLRYKNGRIAGSEKIDDQTQTEKQNKRLKLLLSDPMIGNAIDHAVLYYAGTPERPKQLAYLDFKQKIKEELKR